ncbi:uncharacterized protein LOC116840588 [Odontomachus brunneus]|uniref:uncharacterized protein LOC116840588 n=1 Tax=Odontomachus brunneus TaxID=486640 RepID=UPI0013F214FA|nr:uncharacterized protein LOC116840588 [Odontomachus brunneus]
MPVGVSWLRYISFTTAAMLSMLAGSQCVHMIYKPLDDLDELVELKLKERMDQQGEARRKEEEEKRT